MEKHGGDDVSCVATCCLLVASLARRVVPSRLCAGVDRRAARLGTRARASRDASPRALLRHAISSGPRVVSPPSPAMLRHAVSQFSARAATMGVGAAAASAPGAAECAKKEDASKTVTSSFDPEALERGAKALREINNSIHAKKVRAQSPLSPPGAIARAIDRDGDARSDAPIADPPRSSIPRVPTRDLGSRERTSPDPSPSPHPLPPPPGHRAE